MTRSLLLLSVTALLLPACQAGEKPGNNIAEGNAAAAVDVGADEQAIPAFAKTTHASLSRHAAGKSTAGFSS